MNLDRLYDLAEAEKIKIYDYCIDENIDGMFLNYDKLNAIALNYNNFENSYEEKCVLAEELGHYYLDATYNYKNADKELYYKQEYRARKYSISMLIPYEDLKSAIKNGIDNLYSLADYFEVSVQYMKNAIQFYINKYGDFTKEALSY